MSVKRLGRRVPAADARHNFRVGLLQKSNNLVGPKKWNPLLERTGLTQEYWSLVSLRTDRKPETVLD